jgi:uncharacterized membrane protein YphA (DoxX/SURF4 family)
MNVGSGRARRIGLVLAALRVFFGALFLAVWADNLHKGLYSPGGYAGFVGQYGDTTVFGFMAYFIKHIVIPHAAIFARGQMVVELAFIALPLLAGFLTPIAGIVAAGFSLNLLLSSWGSGEWQGVYLMMLAISLTVVLTQSGRTLGVDALLARREPRPKLPIY